jgi:hypothetical protein
VKIRAPQVLLVLVLAAMATVISGCATEPDNASVRPWNSSEGWEGGALNGMMNDQHR